MHAVIIVKNFDQDTPTVLFDNYYTAKAYLHWLWEDYYNTEIEYGSDLDTINCFHEDSYAKVTWVDGATTEFILTYISEPDKRFATVDHKRYL